jgi:hypothetical protein
MSNEDTVIKYKWKQQACKDTSYVPFGYFRVQSSQIEYQWYIDKETDQEHFFGICSLGTQLV